MSVLRLVTFQNLYFVTKDPSCKASPRLDIYIYMHVSLTTRTDSDASLWSPLECNMAIICASIPSYRPLISHYFPNLLSGGASGRDGSDGSDGTNGSSGSNSVSKARRQNANSYSLAEMGAGSRSHGLQKLGDNDSEEQIIHHKGVVKVYESDRKNSF